MLFALVFILVIMLVGLAKHCLNNGKILVDHVFCLCVGYLYYVILPLFVFELQINIGDVLYKSELAYYNDATIESKLYYLLVSFSWIVVFYIGNRCSRYVFGKRRLIFKKQPSNVTFNLTQKVFFVPVILLGIIIVYQVRDVLFLGYTSSYSSSTRGGLSAFVITLFSLVLLHVFSNNMTNLKSIFLNKWGIAYMFFAILLLSMGGRLYVVSNMLALIICITYLKSDGIKIGKMISLVVVGVLFIGAIGIVRLSITSEITLADILFNILQEALYTNYSLVTYLNSDTFFDLLSFPKVFLSSFINLIPSAIFTNKSEYIMNVLDLEPTVLSPLGAMHYFVSYNADFGIILSLVLFLILGYFLGYLGRNREKNSIISNVVYALVSSNLMFTIFRDPVSTALMKNIFEFSILIPIIVIVVNNQVSKLKGSTKKYH